MSGYDPELVARVKFETMGPRSVRESEEMTIYDVLRHIIDKTPWDGMDFNEENERKAAATSLIDSLETKGILGQIALNTTEEV